MSSRSRYTSPLHAPARSVAQRGLLKPLVWRLVTVTVLGEEHLKALRRPEDVARAIAAASAADIALWAPGNAISLTWRSHSFGYPLHASTGPAGRFIRRRSRPAC